MNITADIQLNGIDLPRLNDATCFNFPNYRLGEWDDSPCDTVSLQQTGDGFVRTWYDPAHWQPETQEQQRLIHLFSDENQVIYGEERNHDPLRMTNPALFEIENVPPKPAQVRQHSDETLLAKNGKSHE